MTTPMTTRTTTQSVTERVRAKVLDGELSPGSRLQERQLAAALGVSRTPVRDALQVLASEGLLDYSPHSGYIVRRFGLSEVLDSFDVRIALEGMASRKLAEIGPSPETIELLTENVRRSLEVVDVEQWTSNSRTRWLELNLEFHDTILNAVGNRYLIRGVQDAQDLLATQLFQPDEVLAEIGSGDEGHAAAPFTNSTPLMSSTSGTSTSIRSRPSTG